MFGVLCLTYQNTLSRPAFEKIQASQFIALFNIIKTMISKSYKNILYKKDIPVTLC